MTLKELVQQGIKQVIVISYGYESAGVFSHFEPFRNKRRFIFDIIRIGKNEFYLRHDWLFFVENEDDIEFDIVTEDGVQYGYIYDPDLKEYSSNY